MKRLLWLTILSTSFSCLGQTTSIYPTNWWVGMRNPSVELMIHSPGIKRFSHVSISYPGIKLIRVQKVESPNYLFIDLYLSTLAKPGTCPIQLTDGTKQIQIKYDFKARRLGNGTRFAQGVHSDDFIYLLMPDRFSNGDSSNDRVAGMRDQSLNRDSIFLRHGGDLQGVINHLDYLRQLGVTALWLTPVLENDMPNRTEHGYACTNHYQIDPRLGNNTLYMRLGDELHQQGMKLIQDAVYNHVGLFHFLMQDPPSKDWFHQWPAYTQTNYRDQTQFDPYGDPGDKKIMTDGWFTPEMPDLNQQNPLLANFLIQHAIWCVESFGVDAFRIDTYIYLDLKFMNRCNQALLTEYPKITMFGEAWVSGMVNQAFFTRNKIDAQFKSNLIGVTDFQSLFQGIGPALTNPPNGVEQLYQTASCDLLYENPMNNVIFLDNHDMTRFLSQVQEDLAKDRIGVQWLLTWRGIPELYYGTEVLMSGVAKPDGWVRLDFPGGWSGDQKNAFTGQGLSDQELAMQEMIRKLANFRKSSTALTRGKLMQFIPKDGLYIYFRYDDRQSVMCVMNTDSAEKKIDFAKYKDRTMGFQTARDVATGQSFRMDQIVTIPPTTMWVLDLRP